MLMTNGLWVVQFFGNVILNVILNWFLINLKQGVVKIFSFS